MTEMMPLTTNGVSYGSMSNHIIAAIGKSTAKFTKLSSLPTVSTRTKKLEQSEREKRARKRNSSGSGDGSDSSASGGHFTANDGSREGRRMERERRRAEHNAKNNVKPKTPEEIAGTFIY